MNEIRFFLVCWIEFVFPPKILNCGQDLMNEIQLLLQSAGMKMCGGFFFPQIFFINSLINTDVKLM